MSTCLVREIASDYLQLPLDQQESVRKAACRLAPMEPVESEDAEDEDYEKTINGQGKAIAKARAAGFTIIEGTPNTLLLDLDADKVLNEDCLRMLCDLVKEVPTKSSWKSKSGNTHVLFHFEETTFTEAEAVALEAALGSDQKRACLYILRLRNNVQNPRVLFMPPTNKGIEALEDLL